MNNKKVLEKILKRPYQFREAVNPSPKSNLFKEINQKSERENIINNITDSPFGDLVKGLAENEIYEIYQGFERKIEKVKDWLLNSEIRAITFYYLGELGNPTATEIADKSSNNPKSISTYIYEFRDKNWVNEPEKEGRKKKYSLSEKGQSFYNLARDQDWFRNIIKKKPILEETIIKLKHAILRSEENLLNYERYVNKEPALRDYGKNFYFESEHPEIWTSVQDLIDKISDISKALANKLGIDLKLPKIQFIRPDMLSIASTDREKLAFIFAAFNKLEKNKIRNKELWEISRIRIITAESFFDYDMPSISKGFMSSEETEAYKKKIMNEFYKKIQNNDLK